MKLHIANVTKQDRIFVYSSKNTNTRRPEFAPTIQPGKQIIIEDEKPALESIVKQHRVFGLVEFDVAARTPQFAGLCYRFDAVIPSQAMLDSLEKRRAFEDERAQAVRESAAAAMAHGMEMNLRQEGIPLKVEAEVTLEEKRSDENEGGKKPIVQKITTDRNLETKRTTNQKRKAN